MSPDAISKMLYIKTYNNFKKPKKFEKKQVYSVLFYWLVFRFSWSY